MSHILFISTIIPYPPRGGHPQRTYNLLRYAARENDIYFIGFIKKNTKETDIRELEKICCRVYPFHAPDDTSRYQLVKGVIRNLFTQRPYTVQKYHLPAICAKIKEIVDEFQIDILHCDMIDLADYYYDCEGLKKVVVFHNIESKLMYRRARYEKNILKKGYLYLQSNKMKSYEAKMASKFDRCIVVSELEKRELLKESPRAKVSVIYNGVDVDYFRPYHNKKEIKTNIVFIGGMDWFPNEDGIYYFLSDIWTLMCKEIKEVRLFVIGNKDTTSRNLKEIMVDNSNSIHFLGFVDDVRPYVEEAGVFIVPLRIGGGTRLKIVDALSMGKAVVSTSIGCEGLEVTNNRDIIIQDDPVRFAKSICEVIRDDELRRTLGDNGRRLVEEKYSWEIVGNKMN